MLYTILGSPTNIRLGYKCLPGTKTLAYFARASLKIAEQIIKSVTAEAGLWNKSLCFAPTLGVTKFIIVKDIISVTLCCAAQVQLRCSKNISDLKI